MNESPTVQATSKPDDKPADSRIVLYFETLKRKVRTPEFMHLDEALDRLGVRDFPLEWGMSAIWRKAPFQYESRPKRFYKYALKKTEEGYRLNKRRLKSGRQSRRPETMQSNISSQCARH